MKIAVLFRGPLRPSPAHTRAYVAEFMKNFSALGISPTTYLATWHPDKIDDDFSQLVTQDIDNLISIGMPSAQLIGPDLYEALLPSGHRARNIFYQHYVSKMAIDLITSHENYDFIIHTRTDLQIDFGDYFPRWLESDKIDKYQTMHTRDIHFPGSHINDQIAVAAPDIMKRAWDYHTFDELRGRIAQVVANAGKAEDVLQSILDDAGITAIGTAVVTYWLDGDRHK